MLEVETKFISPGNERVESALRELGATLVSDEEAEDVYFRHPCKDFGKSDEALRLRKKQGESELTYKGPRMKTGSAKAREEITLKTTDPLSVQRIVERLGFVEFMTVKKKRKTFVYEKILIAVDVVDELGEFIELELITEEPNRASVLIEEMRSSLGLKEVEPRTYLEMVLSEARSD
jgi:adenylate cyclase class 2